MAGRKVFPIFSLPSSLFFLLPLAGYWAVLIYYMGAQWSVYEQYGYGWAVPFLCVYLAYARVRAGDGRSQIGDRRAESRDGGRGGVFQAQSSIFYLLLAFLALLYLPTRILHEANPVWRLTSWLWALEVVGLTLITAYVVHSPQSTDRGQGKGGGKSRKQKAESRNLEGGGEGDGKTSPSPFQHFSFPSLAFPICFFLVAVPWPTGVEIFITQSLMRLNTATTIELLGLFGIPAVQHANVIEVATGVVGINEACSGIRSLQATLMLSLFFGEVYALSTVRRAFCVLAGFALAFLFNVGRTFLLTWVASAKGVDAVASWHDPAGVTILVGCFLSLWGMAWAGGAGDRREQKAERERERGERRKEKAGDGGQCAAQAPSPTGSASVPAGTAYPLSAGGEGRGEAAPPRSPLSYLLSPISYPRLLPWALLGWLVVVEAGTQIWYRSHEHGSAATSNWAVNLDVAEPAVTRVEMPQEIRGQFRADQSLEGRWQDSGGNAFQLYYFRWLPDWSLKNRVAIQMAKTHGPEKCLPRAGMKLQDYLGIITVPVAGMELAMQQYVFTSEGSRVHVFYGIYEDPTGSAVLANRRQNTADRIKAALAGSRNYGQRYLEVAVGGYERPEDARAALTRELGKLIRVESHAVLSGH